MLAVATTTVSILRGTTTDQYGDPADNDTVAGSGIPASIIETRRTTTTESEQLPRVVRYPTGRLPSGTDVRSGDRLRDERTSTVYVIDAVTQDSNPALTPDLRLDLRRVT